MNERYSFYYQENNKLFNDNVLVICYNAPEDEIEKYGLTSNNIVLFVKSKIMNRLINENNVNYLKTIPKLFEKEILIRIQSECLLGMYGDSHCDCEEQKKEFINILREKDGIFIHLPQEAQGWGLFYKCKELEIQVNGRNQNGEFIGKLNRDDAQRYLIKTDKFEDKRSYDLICKILKDLKLQSKKFIVYTESEHKINSLVENGLKAIRYSEYIKESITSENASEYLIKILNETHQYTEDIIDNLCDIIKERNYNDRTLNTLIDIVSRIKNDKAYKIDSYTKKAIMDAYNEIICGEERNYIFKYSSMQKRQNKFTCEVNPLIFKQLKTINGKNIFDRICLEKMQYFLNTTNLDIMKIRTSKVLDINDEQSAFFVGQIYNVERLISIEKKNIVEDTTSGSKVQSMFENSDYEYVKYQEMLTFISENEVPGVNIYIKRVPNRQNYIMDVYGKKEYIHKFIDKLTKQKVLALLSFVNNLKLEDDNYSDYNLKFSNLDLIIKEELDNFKEMKGISHGD